MTIRVNTEKAKEISLGRVRAARDEKFIELTKKEEQGANVASERAKLRKATDPILDIRLDVSITLAEAAEKLLPLEALPDVGV